MVQLGALRWLKEGRRKPHQTVFTTPSVADRAGDLSFVLPYQAFSSDPVEMLHALDGLAPSRQGRQPPLWGRSQFYSSQIQLTRRLETPVEDLFAVGDGAGVTRGLVQASASGIIAARGVLHRLA